MHSTMNIKLEEASEEEQRGKRKN